jgi:site-specific recombinase XerD
MDKRLIGIFSYIGREFNHIQFIKTDERLRANIKRSRRTKKRDVHFSETKNKELKCTRAGIEVKSAHDIRRTVASEMDGKGVSIEYIHWYLGHNDIATTCTYILNNQGKQNTS